MLSLESLDTEKRNINTMNLDELSTVEIIEKINQEEIKLSERLLRVRKIPRNLR